jgi:hypothetical protein
MMMMMMIMIMIVTMMMRIMMMMMMMPPPPLLVGHSVPLPPLPRQLLRLSPLLGQAPLLLQTTDLRL